jgi:SWIM zinc finger
MSLAQPAHPSTRELRALQLYRTCGHDIRQVDEDLYLVPGCTGRGFYSVDDREETCDCPDFLYSGENCKHILAVGVLMAKTMAARARLRRDEATPHACDSGWVWIGQIVVDPETGEETEEFAQYLCRKCAERS